MIAEAIDKLVELAAEARKPYILRAEGEPGHVYFLVDRDGKIEVQEAEAKPRAHTAQDVDTVCAFAERYAELEVGVREVGVWYNRQGVVVLLDDVTRRDMVTLTLKPTPEIQTLSELKLNDWLSQAELLRLLRIRLRRTLQGNSESLIDIIRKVRFRTQSEGERSVGHTKASLGKSIESEVWGDGTIPEHFTVFVQVWDGVRGVLGTFVKVYLEVDPGAEKFAVVAAPGEVERAWREAEEQLGQELRSALASHENIGVYFGRP